VHVHVNRGQAIRIHALFIPHWKPPFRFDSPIGKGDSTRRAIIRLFSPFLNCFAQSGRGQRTVRAQARFSGAGELRLEFAEWCHRAAGRARRQI